MIVLHRRDRLGNCLFQYCFARVLAERFGYGLQATPFPGFPGTFAVVEGEEIFGPVVVWMGQWPIEAYAGRAVHEQELFTSPGARLTLNGWFQRYELIAEAHDQIRADWLKLEHPVSPRASSDLVICMRLGDYVQGVESGETASAADTFSNSTLREEEVRRLARVVSHRRL